jgi:hypothetical protein
MQTGFEVGAIFRVLDEASPGLRKILAQVRELNKAIEQAKTNLAGFGQSVAPGINGAVVETDRLAAAWTKVSESALAAGRSIGTATAAAARSVPGGGGGGGGRHRPGWLGAGAASHGMRTGGMVAGGAVGWGVYTHMRDVLMTFTETSPANKHALIGPVLWAVSDILKAYPSLFGDRWFQIVDGIDLAACSKSPRSTAESVRRARWSLA